MFGESESPREVRSGPPHVFGKGLRSLLGDELTTKTNGCWNMSAMIVKLHFRQ